MTAALQRTFGALDASVSYLEVSSHWHRVSQQPQCRTLGQKNNQEKIPKRIVPENLSILYIHSLHLLLQRYHKVPLCKSRKRPGMILSRSFVLLYLIFLSLKAKPTEAGDAGTVF